MDKFSFFIICNEYEKLSNEERFRVPTAARMNMTVGLLWNVTLCSLV
jgi:hypothetical protein